MKKVLCMIIVIMIFVFCATNKEKINSYLIVHFTDIEQKPTTLENNQYAKSEQFYYVQLTDSFVPQNQKDIINIYYTVLNSGMNDFTFYCPESYQNCIEDVKYISNNQTLLSNINNFVPVYNIFQTLDTEFNNLGKVTIHITHTYEPEQIELLETTVTNIINQVITENMSIEEQIKAIHDYIINHTKYDINRSDNKVTTYHSDTAYGTLIEHYGICGGYADSMKLFLDYLKIPNYKISSENHVWNLVYLNDQWYHLDLTWDDPVTSTGEDVLEYDYFLITSKELQELETDQHVFDVSIYQEANSN